MLQMVQLKMLKTIKSSAEILNYFTHDAFELGVTEASKRIGLSKSAVSRILSTLGQARLVSKNPVNHKYRLGPKVLELADIFLMGMGWRAIAIPHLKELGNKTDETVMIFILDGDRRVCMEKFESSHELRSVLNIGGRYPLHAGSAGKVLLAYLPEEERRKILAGMIMPKITPNTVTNPKELEKQFAQIRKQGYAVSHQERTDFMSSISAPIKDHSGKVIAAVCIDGPTFRFTNHKLKKFKELLLSAAETISREIGHKIL
jgi:DNA-binding IclR family transcriptional regulator